MSYLLQFIMSFKETHNNLFITFQIYNFIVWSCRIHRMAHKDLEYGEIKDFY